MTQERDLRIQELLAAAIPAPDATPHENWSAVLERAEASKRRRRFHLPTADKRAGAGLAVAAAVIFAAVLFWPSAVKHSVLDRALAAVSGGPIIHVTYRVKQDYAFVDLHTGRRTLVFVQYEEWLDPSGALRSAYKDGSGRLHVTVLAPGKNTLSGHQRETYSGILDGYRKALENGTATLSAKTRFRGRDIYWVRFKGQKMLNVSGHTSRYQDWALEVAIDASTYRPVYLYETIDGRPQAITGQEIVSVETLPSGSVDFTPTTSGHKTGYAVVTGGFPPSSVDLTAELDTGAPEKALGAPPIWLGPSYQGQKLAFLRAGKATWGFAPPSVRPRDMKLQHAPAVELCYGSTTITTISRDHRSIYCDYRGPHVLLQEALEPIPGFGWATAVPGSSDFNKIPGGSVMVFPGGGRGLIIENGVYVSIDAKSEAAVIAVARALTPLRAD